MQSSIDCIKMPIFRLEMELQQWLPGGIANFVQHFADFIGDVLNHLPGEVTYLSSELSDDNHYLVMRFEVPEDPGDGGAGAAAIPLLVLAAIVVVVVAAIFVFGAVVIAFKWLDERTEQIIAHEDDCRELFEGGYLNPEQYLECLNAGSGGGGGPFDKALMMVGGALFLVGGGWLVLQFMQMRKGGKHGN